MLPKSRCMRHHPSLQLTANGSHGRPGPAVMYRVGVESPYVTGYVTSHSSAVPCARGAVRRHENVAHKNALVNIQPSYFRID